MPVGVFMPDAPLTPHPRERNRDLDLAKAREIPRWGDAEGLTSLERDVLAHAGATISR